MLYEHNIPVYAAFKQMLAEHNKAILVTATGTGKTHIAMEYLEENNFHALVVVPKLSIGQQWEKNTSKVTTITYQSFCKQALIDLNKYDCVIFDEAHHCGSPVWGVAVKRFMKQATVPVIGLTADSVRWMDSAKDVADELWDGCLVTGYDQGEAIRCGILPQITYVCALYDSADMAKQYLDNPAVSDKLKHKLELSVKNRENIAAILQKHACSQNNKGIVFVSSIRDIPNARKLVRESFPTADISEVHSDLAKQTATKAIDEFIAAKDGFLIAVDMLNEGVHIKGVNVVIMLRKTESPNVYMQQCGRGLASGGENPVLFDFVGNSCNLKIAEQRIREVQQIYEKRDCKISCQTIIYDYCRDFLRVIKDIEISLLKCRPWTKQEDSILREFYPTEKGRVIKRLEGRSSGAIRGRVRALGLQTMDVWSKDEIEILSKYYPIEGTKVCARLPGRTPRAIQTRAVYCGLKRVGIGEWTKEENEILKQLYPKYGSNIVDRLPNHSRIAIGAQARRLNIKVLQRKAIKKKPAINKWTEEEDGIIKKYYPQMGEKVANILKNRTVAACLKRANFLGIKSEAHYK